MQETQEMPVQSRGQEDPLEEGRATHSSILAWTIPWIAEPGGLHSQRVRHDGSDLACTHAQNRQNTSNTIHVCVRVCKSLPSCPTLCDPADCSPSGSSVHGILQARTLERVARPSSTQAVLKQNYSLGNLTKMSMFIQRTLSCSAHPGTSFLPLKFADLKIPSRVK